MFKGVLKKMISEMANPIRYFLNFENDFFEPNHRWQGEIEGLKCVHHVCKQVDWNSPFGTRDGWRGRLKIHHHHVGWASHPELSLSILASDNLITEGRNGGLWHNLEQG